MIRSLALVLALSASALALGCATRYHSFYRETDSDLRPRPVAPEQVAVVRSRNDLHTAWTRLGDYEGHAPTVKEAMDAAKRACGRAGADYFILDVPPFDVRGLWKVDGICAAETAAPPKPEE